MHVRFLCIANSVRSQMAEGAFRSLADESFEVSSAGSFSKDVDENAIKVMKEAGVDISSQKSKGLDDWGLDLPKADLIIDLTEEAIHRKRFAHDPELVYLNSPVYDPITAKGIPAEDRLPLYRNCRDAIFKIVSELLTMLRLPDGINIIRDKSQAISNTENYQQFDQTLRNDDGFDSCIDY